MRVTKSQIVHGVTDYISKEILPKMSDDRAMQIILSIAVNAAGSNNKLVDAAMDHSIVRAMLEDDGSGTYDIGAIAEAMRSAIEQYGSFPVRIPAIPLISPHEITLQLGAGDIEAMRRRVEDSI